LAIVNLPAFSGFYPPRVVEAMAAGRPAVTYRVPERPRLADLFDETEAFFYDLTGVRTLTNVLRLIRTDRLRAERVARAGHLAARLHHTTEHRTRQVLDWIETGREPTYRS
jgi:hypothetical protein